MAGNIVAGFVKGFSGRALDQIDQRKKEEQEIKKAEMLERLRRETMEYSVELAERMEKDDVDDKLSSTDFTTGKKVLRNKEGDIIREIDIPKSDMEAYSLERTAADLGLEDARLGLDVKRANIDQSRAAAENSRAYAARARRLDSSDGGSRDSKSSNPDEYTVANELIGKFKTQVAGISDHVPASVISDAAVAATRSALKAPGTPEQRIQAAQDQFLKYLRRMEKDIEDDEYNHTPLGARRLDVINR